MGRTDFGQARKTLDLCAEWVALVKATGEETAETLERQMAGQPQDLFDLARTQKKMAQTTLQFAEMLAYLLACLGVDPDDLDIP